MSILSGRILKDIEKISNLDDDPFEKALVFAVNIINGKENSNKLSELIEIDPSDENELANNLVAFMSSLAKYRLNEKEMISFLGTLKIQESKKIIITRVASESQDEMRRNLSSLDDDSIPRLNKFSWRFDIQVASRSFKSEFKPKVLLNFNMKNSKTDNNLFEIDYTNLKHITDELQKALKVNESANYRKFSKIFN